MAENGFVGTFVIKCAWEGWRFSGGDEIDVLPETRRLNLDKMTGKDPTSKGDFQLVGDREAVVVTWSKRKPATDRHTVGGPSLTKTAFR